MREWCDNHNGLETDIRDIKKNISIINSDISKIKGLLDSGALINGRYLHSELQKVYGRINAVIGGLTGLLVLLGGALAYLVK